MSKQLKIYLAIPYSGIEEESFKIANELTAKLMEEGHIVYSPISHNHTIAVAHGLPRGWEYWKDNDSFFISCCDTLIVVNIDGGERGKQLIENSTGVQAEINIARELKKYITAINYE